jgi:hypothetical protein
MYRQLSHPSRRLYFYIPAWRIVTTQIPFGLKLVPVAIDEHGLVPASLDAIMTQWDAATQVQQVASLSNNEYLLSHFHSVLEA